MRKLIDPKRKCETVLDEKHERPLHAAEGPDKSSKPRDINEDDDGYHPYADRPEKRPMYEEDPWK